MRSLKLGVNIDHVATLRQVRYRDLLHLPNAEPDILTAARLAEEGGAELITVHLRQDRRHIQDSDVHTLSENIRTHLNFEMGVTPEILAIALTIAPYSVCLVPENRQEVTTEGGLDVAGNQSAVEAVVRQCQEAGIRVSLFIDPDPAQVAAAARTGTEMVELHTGSFANAHGSARAPEVRKLVEAARLAAAADVQVNAGHGLSAQNLGDLFAVPHLAELHIGHHLICRAIEVGLSAAVVEIRAIMDRYPAS